ncbi:MAG: ABC transporter substrate-binding protein [Burkholderiales bacterium]|nr:ABC transporter substrate-binding protein [Burkholderiales bacterium]
MRLRSLLVCLYVGLFAGHAAAQAILIGQSVPLSGSNKELGEEIRDGALAFFKRVNEAGGVGGRRIELITLDDGNDTKVAAENGRKLIEERDVLALFGYASATLSRPAMPFAEKSRTPFLFPFTGADPMRVFNRVLYNHRASYADELEKIVNHYSVIGVRSFGILYHEDVVGKENLAAVERALAKRGFKASAVIGITRVNPDIAGAVASVTRSKPDVMITTTLARPNADFIKGARAANPGMQFVSNSFPGPNVLMRMLGKDGVGVTIAQVVPPVTNRLIPIVAEYQAAFEKSSGTKNFGATSLEAYIAAKITVEAIRRAGPARVTRESLMSALDAMKSYDVGGYVVGFSSDNHNGSSFTELTVINRNLQFGY